MRQNEQYSQGLFNLPIIISRIDLFIRKIYLKIGQKPVNRNLRRQPTAQVSNGNLCFQGPEIATEGLSGEKKGHIAYPCPEYD